MEVEHMEPSLASWVEGQHNTKVQKQEHRLGSNRQEGVVGLRICSRQGVHCNKSHDRPEHRLSHNRQDTSEVVVQGRPHHQWEVERRVLDGSTSQYVNMSMYVFVYVVRILCHFFSK